MLAIVTSGCAPRMDSVEPQPSSSATTAERLSEEEAEVAARQVYQRYLEKSLQPSSEDIRDFPSYLTGSALSEERKSLRRSSTKELRVQGHIKLVKFVVQQYDVESEELTAYVCVDLHAARVVNEEGDDVTPPTRVNRQTALAVFRRSDGRIKLAEDAEWSGQSVC